MSDYITFTLDGFHNRMVPDWGRDPAYGAKVKECDLGVTRYRSPKGKWITRSFPAYQIVSIVSWKTACRKHARLHGTAGAWHCDDSLTIFYLDGAKVRVKTFKHARPAQCASEPQYRSGEKFDGPNERSKIGDLINNAE